MTPAPSEQEGDKKKTNLVTKQNAARRLVEYFVVVSSVRQPREEDEKEEQQVHESVSLDEGDDEFFVDDYNFQPKITARYPTEDHQENPLHENVTYFCHPSGNIMMRTEQTMPKVR